MLRTLCRRIWHLMNRRRFERELGEEMREHRERMADPSAFGDSHRLLEASRDAWGWNWLDDAVQDLRLGIRALLRAPGFAAAGVIILAFGIGLNLTFYQITSVALLRPPSIRSPTTLAGFLRQAPTFRSDGLPYAVAAFVASQNTVLSAVMMQSGAQVTWDADGASIDASLVSINWFTEIGHRPQLGRFFSEQDLSVQGLPGVVISDAFWRRAFGADPSVIGRTALIERRAFSIIGVAGPDFPELELSDTAAWIPIHQSEYLYPTSDFLRTWRDNNTRMYGRLPDGISVAGVRENLRATMNALAREHPQDISADEWLEPVLATDNFLLASQRAEIWAILSLFAALMLLVLVVAAANLGNLVLARATGRSRELGVRIALGARRSRIVRQLMVETLPLAVLGAGAASLLAWWVALTIAETAGLPPYLDFSPDWRSVLAAVLLLGLTLVVIGALPAWKVAQQDLALAIKDGGQQVSIGLDRTLLRRFMIGAQVTCSCLLLAVAGMMARSAHRVLTADLGFQFQPVVVLSLPLWRHGIQGDAARAYWQLVKERVRSHPGVVDVALVTARPLGGTVNRTGYKDAPGLKVLAQTVDPSYFSVMQIPILSGRTFVPDDSPNGTAIISKRLAFEMYGGMEVLGRGFPRSAPERTIVGVAGDAHTIVVTATNVAEMYAPVSPAAYSEASLITRARSAPEDLIPVLREAAAVDSRVIPTTTLMRDDFVRRTRPTRLASTIAASIGGLTLFLASLGIFGVVSYGAALRRKEIGIHLALGADKQSIIRLIVRRVMTPIAIGMALGATLAAPVGFMLSTEPFYLSPIDPGIYALALMVFLASGLTAAFIPAFQALRTDPLGALRQD
jgi:predicted permease